jgi:hypothetical protein
MKRAVARNSCLISSTTEVSGTTFKWFELKQLIIMITFHNEMDIIHQCSERIDILLPLIFLETITLLPFIEWNK